MSSADKPKPAHRIGSQGHLEFTVCLIPVASTENGPTRPDGWAVSADGLRRRGGPIPWGVVYSKGRPLVEVRDVVPREWPFR